MATVTGSGQDDGGKFAALMQFLAGKDGKGGLGRDTLAALGKQRGAIQAAAANPLITSAAPALYAAGSLASGDVLGGVGELTGGIAGANLAGKYLSPLVQGAVKALPGGRVLAPLAGLATTALGGYVAGGAGGGIARRAGDALGNIAQSVTGAAKGAQREAGKSPGLLGLTGEQIAALSPEDQERLIRAAGAGALEQAYPTMRAMRDNELQRQMQLNQQLAQLTGGLNQQRYLAQLTNTGMGEAGATTRSMINAPNPYAASAFQYNAPGSL
jgi:hypothetical protein